jgi:two-component system, NarL family, response regulator NreC
MRRASFVVVEPNYLIRKGLVGIINEMPNAAVIREVESTSNILEFASHQTANIVVANHMAFNNIDVNELNKFSSKRKKTLIVLLAQSEADVLQKLKSISEKIILYADSKSAINAKLKAVISKVVEQNSDEKTQASELSERETEILKDVALGLSNKEIADKNYISAHTVITHRKNITRKLGIKTVSGLTIYAIINRIIGIDEAN